MIKFLSLFEKFYSIVHHLKVNHLTKITDEFIETYETKFKEKPTALQIKKYRKDYVLRIGMIVFLFVLIFLYFIII